MQPGADTDLALGGRRPSAPWSPDATRCLGGLCGCSQVASRPPRQDPWASRDQVTPQRRRKRQRRDQTGQQLPWPPRVPSPGAFAGHGGSGVRGSSEGGALLVACHDSLRSTCSCHPHTTGTVGHGGGWGGPRSPPPSSAGPRARQPASAREEGTCSCPSWSPPEPGGRPRRPRRPCACAALPGRASDPGPAPPRTEVRSRARLSARRRAQHRLNGARPAEAPGRVCQELASGGALSDRERQEEGRRGHRLEEEKRGDQDGASTWPVAGGECALTSGRERKRGGASGLRRGQDQAEGPRGAQAGRGHGTCPGSPALCCRGSPLRPPLQGWPKLSLRLAASLGTAATPSPQRPQTAMVGQGPTGRPDPSEPPPPRAGSLQQ